MPRYFFNLANGVNTRDFSGVVLPNLEAAKREAEKDIADIKGTNFNSLSGDWTAWSVQICEQEGGVLLVVPFSKN